MEEAAHRHVLAERHTAHLVVAVEHLALGGDDDLRVGEVVAVGRVLGDAHRERRTDARRLRGDRSQFGAALEGGDVDDVLRPHHQIDGPGLDGGGGLEVPLEHLAGRSVDGMRALWPAALHGGDPQGLRRGGVVGDSQRADGPDPQRDDEGDDAVPLALGGDAPLAGECRHHRRRAGEREAELEDEPGEEQGAADTDHAHERAGRLADGETGEGHAAEGEREPSKCLLFFSI